MTDRYRRPILDDLIGVLAGVRHAARTLEQEHASSLGQIPEGHRGSARNLLHYLALRRCDLREHQLELSRLGLSSLGRAESHVLESLDSVLLALHRLTDTDWSLSEAPTEPFEEETTRGVLEQRAETLLGPYPSDRGVRIMVTMPSWAAKDPSVARELVLAGMDVARINAAHDDRATWERIANNVRRAADELGRTCRIMVDLPGPKLRTCSLGEGPRVMRFKPDRDARGQVVEPVRVHLVRASATDQNGAISISDELVDAGRVGDDIRATDASGDKRSLRVMARTEDTLLIECDHTVRFETGRPLRLRRNGETVVRGEVGPLPAVDNAFPLVSGDLVRLVPEGVAPRAARHDQDGTPVTPAVIPTTLGSALTRVQVDDTIRFDDGRIGGVVEAVDTEGVLARIQFVPPGGASLRGDKGINLPDTDLALQCPTADDLVALDFAVAHADVVGMSFVQRPEDVLRLQDEMAARGGHHLGVVLKIETRRAFRNLPALLLTGMRSPPVGVMVARGDLAVEVGFARLAEVQEEILWLCEAAHVPVIWATQVLEGLAKTGLPSRAEVTDAAMGVRAECVMLNKGPYIIDALRMLDDVLRRMRAHHQKKRALLRPLSVAWLDETRR